MLPQRAGVFWAFCLLTEGPPPAFNHQNFGTKTKRLKRLQARFAGEFFSALDLDLGKKVGMSKIVAPLDMDSRGDLSGAGADDMSRSIELRNCTSRV